MRLYNERSGVEFDAWFENNAGTPALPTTVHYRLMCVTNDQAMVDWTLVAADTLYGDNGAIQGIRAHIQVPGSANRLISERREVKELQVVADKDLDSEYSEVLQYGVVSMGRR